MIEIISRLPEGYQEVEYIESSGTQYIDTGVKPNQDTGVTIDFQLTNVSSWQCIFGAANSRQETDEYAVWHSGTNFGFYYASTNVTVGADATTRHQFVCSKNSLSVDGTAYRSPAYTNFTTNYNLILGAVNYAGNIQYLAPVKLYSAKIYANGVLVRDFIPCKNVNGVVGLWDNVNNQFYTNSGSGTFTAGRDVGDIVITPGGVIPMQYALRRRMMMAGGGGAFEFTYTGQFTDKIEGSNRVIKLTSSGTLNVSGSAIADVYLLAGGGGSQYSDNVAGGGGGGGNQTLTKFRIAEGSYSINIGEGGRGGYSSSEHATVYCAQPGGSTSGFGYTVTGGNGGCAGAYSASGGAGGSPNGIAGSTSGGGSPNGGWRSRGGDGYITITVPV